MRDNLLPRVVALAVAPWGRMRYGGIILREIWLQCRTRMNEKESAIISKRDNDYDQVFVAHTSRLT